MRKFILGLDEGTTSLRSVLYDVSAKKIVASQNRPLKVFYPQKAWVEQDAEEIYRKLKSSAKAVLKELSVQRDELLAVGLTNQRETVVAWDRETGKVVSPAISWQCRRTTNMIKNLTLKQRNFIQHKTGLIANPYFSASKFKWILENCKEARALAQKERLCLGTIDSFLAFKLTGNFVTDTTNASRTMLMDLKTLDWDDELLQMFKLKRNMLPKILPCDSNFGEVKAFFGSPLHSIIGDQQSSMIGQGCLEVGQTKVTFGTGGFVLTNIGEDSYKITPKLLTTVARTIKGKTEYALEGSIYSACSAINFLKTLCFYEDVKSTAKMAESLPSNEGVYFVPAFTGLGSPYWKDDARASIMGMTFDTKKEHIVRACLESLAYNTRAVVDEIKLSMQRMGAISVDGGGSKNEFVLQFLADILNHKVIKSLESESTVMGTIYTALLGLGIFDKKDIKELTKSDIVYSPNMTETQRSKLYDGWKKIIKKL